MQLQRTAGNRAVAGALAVQRKGGVPATARERGEALEQRVAKAGQSSAATTKLLVGSVRQGVALVDAMLEDLGAVSGVYEGAYKEYERVLAAGRAHAAAMDALADAVMGILVGATVGLSLGAALPLAAGAGRAMKLAFEIKGEVVEALAGAAVKAAKDGGGDGRRASPEGLAAFEAAHPAMQRVRAYKQAASLYRDLAVLSVDVQSLGDVDAVAAGLRADCRELALRGRHRTLSEAEIATRVTKVEGYATGQANARGPIEQLGASVDDARIAASVVRGAATAKAMEHDIWVHWMASLSPDEASILGSDPIEKRLASLRIMAKRGMDNAPQRAWESTIGWGVGAWHSEDNSKEGARLALRGSQALRMVGETGRFKRGSESSAGRFTDASGKEWPAVPQSDERSAYELERAGTVVVTKASPSGDLLWVDLPAGAADDRRQLFYARQLPGKSVTLTNVFEPYWANGSPLYYPAKVTSPDFPGRTWRAEVAPPPHLVRPTVGSVVVVTAARGATLVVRLR